MNFHQVLTALWMRSFRIPAALSVQASDVTEASGLNHTYKTMKLTVVVGQHDVILGTLSLSPIKPGERNRGVQP